MALHFRQNQRKGMKMENDQKSDKSTVLFRLDLSTLGVKFEPYTSEEILRWVQTELDFWSWARHSRGGTDQSLIDRALNQLEAAKTSVAQYRVGLNPTENLEDVQFRIQAAIQDLRLPHSSTQLAKDVESLRQRSSEMALALLFASMANPYHEVESTNSEVWQAYVAGLFRTFRERHALELQAVEEKFASLQEQSRKLLRELQTVHESSDRAFQAWVRTATEKSDSQNKAHAEFATLVRKEHADLLAEHKLQQDALRRSFREEMALRGPVEYWESRETRHSSRSFDAVVVFAVAVGLLALFLWGVSLWVVETSASKTTGQPDVWRLAVLGFVAALGVWLLRIIIRVYFSNLHLATDAAERVTMVKTYLALLEGSKLPSEDDRKLILQALFRPTTDGIVKEDGLPNPLLEALTRPGKG